MLTPCHARKVVWPTGHPEWQLRLRDRPLLRGDGDLHLQRRVSAGAGCGDGARAGGSARGRLGGF